MKLTSKVLALALLAAVGAAPAAQAQSKWTGFSIGVGVGAGAINHDLTIGPGPALPPGLFNFNFDGIGGEGFLGTVGVAADMQVHPQHRDGHVLRLRLCGPGDGSGSVDPAVRQPERYRQGEAR